MSRCEIRHDIGGYVLGALESDEVARLEAHLDACPECRAELERLSGVSPLLDLVVEPPPVAPRDLRDRVVVGSDEAAAQGPPRRDPRVAVRTLVAGLVGLLVGAAAMLTVPLGGPPDSVVAFADEGVAGEVELRDTDAGVRLDLEASGLPVDLDDAYYQVWLETGSGERVSAGSVLPDADGEVYATLICGGELGEYTSLVITAHAYVEAEGDTVVTAQLD